tara:strand:+ start:215 stop:2131 length:1917 start_codon:yes stop_codon:yes gene_type:complete
VCGALIEDNAIFCDACGALQESNPSTGSEEKVDEETDSTPMDADSSEASEAPATDSASDEVVEEDTEEDSASNVDADNSTLVPPPIDELIPAELPELPKVSGASMAPPAPIEFAAPKPVSTIPQPANQVGSDGQADTSPPPISYEGDAFTDSVPPEERTAEETAALLEGAPDAPGDGDTPLAGPPENTGELSLLTDNEPSTRSALVAVLTGLLFLCLATWLVARDNQAYEIERRMDSQGENALEKLDLGEVTVEVKGTADAEVFIDGQRLGRIPLSRKVTAGAHVLKVSKRNFEPQQKEFTVKKGEKFEIEVTLTEVASGMAWVESGSFYRGCDVQKDAYCYRYRSEQPGRQIELDGFYIDKTEVTVAEYGECVKAGACVPNGLQAYTGPVNRLGVPTYLKSDMCNWGQAGRDNHPLNCVTWYEADQYCQWSGKDLPTEAQWEKAARGQKGSLYPWGNAEPSCHFAVIKVGNKACSQKQTWDVGKKPEGQSPYGVMDMVGNVSEWVWDRYSAGFYAQAPSKNPVGPNAGFQRGIRGGAWSSIHTSGELRTSYRWRRPPTFRSLAIGFRCAKPAPGKTSVIPRENAAETQQQNPQGAAAPSSKSGGVVQPKVLPKTKTPKVPGAQVPIQAAPSAMPAAQ